MRTRVMRLEAAAALVKSGSTIAVGGFGASGHPMALLYQLVRQRVQDLTLLGITNGNDADLLVGAGCVQRLETAAVSLEEFGLAPNVRRAVEHGTLQLGEYTESTMLDRFLAASMGLTFFPTRVLFGSDVLRVNPDIREVVCPYTGDTYHTVPPARPQWALLHAPASDAYGNVLFPHVEPVVEFDRLLGQAADQVIVTVEKLVDSAVVQRASQQVLVPGFKTAAVVEVPFGAHPCSVAGWYTRDTVHLQHYVEAGRAAETFQRYLQEYVYGVRGHDAYVQRMGGFERLMGLRMDDMVGV